VPEVHHQKLGGQGLAGVPRRADGLAPAAFGAGVGVQDLLPRQVFQGGGSQVGVAAVRLLEVDVQRAEPAPCLGVGEEDVRLRDEAVGGLGVGDVGQDAQDQQDVGQQEHPLEEAQGVGADVTKQ